MVFKMYVNVHKDMPDFILTSYYYTDVSSHDCVIFSFTQGNLNGHANFLVSCGSKE